MEFIYIGEDMNPRWTDATVTPTATGVATPANSATITYALKTAAGVAVSGGTGTLDYISGSSGDYIGVIESTVTSTLTAGAQYVLETTFVQGNYNDFRVTKYRAAYRGRN